MALASSLSRGAGTEPLQWQIATRAPTGWTHQRHVQHAMKIANKLIAKGTPLDVSKRTINTLLLQWVSDWMSTHQLSSQFVSSWGMVMTHVPVSGSVDEIPVPSGSSWLVLPLALQSNGLTIHILMMMRIL